MPAAKFNRAMKIDTKLVNPLAVLPVADPAPENNLAFRNLLRANMVKLATGQQMVTFMRSKGVTVNKLTKAQIKNGNGGASLAALTTTQRNALLDNTPLWFYILREAEFHQGKLHAVGARIAAETFHRAIEGQSVLDRPRHELPSGARPEQHDVPHGRPLELRVQRRTRRCSTRTATEARPYAKKSPAQAGLF